MEYLHIYIKKHIKHLYMKRIRRNQHSGPAWTPEQDAELTAMFYTHTSAQLSQHFDRAVRTIEKYTSRLGLSKGPALFTEAEHALVMQYYPTSGTKHLAPLMGRSTKVLHDYANRHGIGFKRGWAAQDEATMRVLVAQGKTANEIAALLGKTPAAVKNLKFRMGLTSPRKPKQVKQKAPRTARVPQPKPAAVLPKKQPFMRVVKFATNATDYRSKAKTPQGKKPVTTKFKGAQKTSDYLKGLPAKHPHRAFYERLTRPGAPKRFMQYTYQFLEACLEEGLITSLKQAA